MLKNLSFKLTVLILLFGLIACRNKEVVPKPDADLNAAADNSLAENMWADVFKVVDAAAQETPEVNNSGTGPATDTCANITVVVDSTGWPITLIIDFDSLGCTSSTDLRTRSGIIVATFSGRYRDPGTVISVRTIGYFVNDFQVAGVKTITNLGLNTSGNLEYRVNVGSILIITDSIAGIEDSVLGSASITTPDGDIISWASSRTNEWIEGDNTLWPNICDDVYLINGSAEGVDRNGSAFTAEITTALRKEICCPHIVSGVLEIDPSGLDTRVIDYGDGICDGTVLITVAGRSWTIVLD